MLEDRRIYARDEKHGVWHKHPFENPESHNKSYNSQREVTLLEFFTEVKTILGQLGLV